MSVEDGAGDLDDEVKDYSKLFKDYGHHDDKDDDMMDDRLDTVQVYNEEGTPMISIMNTPMIASRTSSPDSLTSDCDDDDGNRYTGNCSSSSRISDSSIGRILGKVSPSDLPASPGDLYDERNHREHDGDNNNNHDSGLNRMPSNNSHMINGGQPHIQRSSLNNYQPLPSPRKTITGSLPSRKPLPPFPVHQPRSRETVDYGNFNGDDEFPPPLPSSSPPSLCSPPSQFASAPSSMSSRTTPPAVPNRPRPGRPAVPPKPSHLKTVNNENGNNLTSNCSSSSRLSDPSSSRILGRMSPLGSLISPLDNSASTESSSDDEDDDDDLLADVIYAGIPKRKKRETIPSPQSKVPSVQQLPPITNKVNDEQGDYLETDIDSIINYEKFLNNQRLTTFEPFEHQV